MRPLFSAKFEKKEDKVDLGDMPIANAKYNCGTCPVMVSPGGCNKKVNTLNCMLVLKRFLKAQETIQDKKAERQEEGTDHAMVDAEKKALADMLRVAMSEAKEEDEDDSTPQVMPPPDAGSACAGAWVCG